MASLLGDSAKYLNVTSGAPSLIMRWTMMSDLKTIVQVESRSRNWSVRKTSATPASPPCVADSMASTYFNLGAASLEDVVSFWTIQLEPWTYLDFRGAFHCLLHGAAGGLRPRQQCQICKIPRSSEWSFSGCSVTRSDLSRFQPDRCTHCSEPMVSSGESHVRDQARPGASQPQTRQARSSVQGAVEDSRDMQKTRSGLNAVFPKVARVKILE